jgi:hypothetical protein
VQVSDEAMATLLRRLVVDPVKAVGGDYKRSLEVRPLWFFWFLHLFFRCVGLHFIAAER